MIAADGFQGEKKKKKNGSMQQWRATGSTGSVGSLVLA